MPVRGRVVERPYTDDEKAGLDGGQSPHPTGNCWGLKPVIARRIAAILLLEPELNAN
jgi:hypothetical protein